VNELSARLRRVPEDNLSIGVGAAALGVGSFLAFGRLADPWADFPLFLVLAVPALILLALGLAFAAEGDPIGALPDGRLAPWQTVCFLIGIPLLLLAVNQLSVVFGNDDPGSGTATLVLLLGGAICVALRTRSESPGLVLLGAILFGGAAIAAINWLDSDAPAATYRDVALILGVLYLLCARLIWADRRVEANLLIGLSGIALIGGAVIGATGNPFPTFFALVSDNESGDGWELILLIVAIGLLAYSAWQRHGGLALIGAVAAYLFVGFATPTGNLWGWPVLLLLLAMGCFAWALVVLPQRQEPGGGAGARGPQPPPPAPQPPFPPSA
jgi:hypothetical protein